MRFIQWYEGGGEQYFDEYLSIRDEPRDEGRMVDVTQPYDETSEGFIVKLK